MKKMLAIVMMIVLVLAMAVPAMAAKSPAGDTVHKVQSINGQGSKTEVNTVKIGDSVSFKSDPDKGKFDEWKIYLPDGKTEAIAGKHYTLGEGQNLSSSTIVLFPLADLIITGNYGGTITDIEIGQNGEVSSPQTGDATVVLLSAVMMLAVAGMVVLKKRAA